ncbi:MAG: OB-fold domain-containing protein [Nitrospirota bacterium]|nr:OB-fold domain-containing protein [Nitrospirota bacterium]
MELPGQGKVHSWTVCNFAGERFQSDVPYTLVLVEFDGVDTMTLGRLENVDASAICIGMQVRTVSDNKDYVRFEPL